MSAGEPEMKTDEGAALCCASCRFYLVCQVAELYYCPHCNTAYFRLADAAGKRCGGQFTLAKGCPKRVDAENRHRGWPQLCPRCSRKQEHARRKRDMRAKKTRKYRNRMARKQAESQGHGGD